MYRTVNKLIFYSNRNNFLIRKRNFTYKPNFDVSEEVRFALETGKPLVALESTIITHGMPFPNNIKCAREVQQVVRKQGAIPATIAIIRGTLKVGISEEELEFLGDQATSKPFKTSRRDLPYVINNKLNGGTTVSATLIAANIAGIPIFASGGIGGVHRGAENTFDISADLIELGKCNVAVVASGVKSILDIPKTLEYLETQGVFVATFGDTDEFPAFYSRISGIKAPYCVRTAEEAAGIIRCSRDMGMNSGMLFAVPIPEEYSLDPETINGAIENALRKADSDPNIRGKNITPFLLSQVEKITEGKSLQSNIALIRNNAKTAADIAVALVELPARIVSSSKENKMDASKIKGRPVVIGGSNLDCSVHLDTSEIQMDGRIFTGKFSYAAGGVARNICESLFKLGYPSNFISAVGDDDQGKLLKPLIPPESSHLVKVLKTGSTAQCIVVFDKTGDCKFLMGDMDIHKQITAEMILAQEKIIKTAPLIILDANLTTESLGEALRLADKYSIPVFFEPTDLEISTKPFETQHWKAIKFISPNLNELRYISKFLNIPINYVSSDGVKEAAEIAKQLANYVETVIVTLGPNGALIARKGLANDSFLINKRSEVSVRHYPGEKISNFVNVSGAGDCLASGIVAGVLAGLSEENCMSIGFTVAQLALYSQSAVPREMFSFTHSAWKESATFRTIF